VRGFVGKPSVYGTTPEESAARALEIIPDRVEATTSDGHEIPCDVRADDGDAPTYECIDFSGLREVTVYIGDQRWSRSTEGLDCDDFWRWELTVGPSISFWLDDLAACVEPEGTVLEGQLIGYDAELAPPASVRLEGPRQAFTLSTGVFAPRDAPPAPSRPCEVLAGGHFRCRAVGYRRSEEHRVVVTVGERTTTSRVTLPVDNCEAEVVVEDVAACSGDAEPFAVTFNHSGVVQVSYEGGPLYRCVPSENYQEHICPPGPNSRYGEGRYEVIAVANGAKYAAQVTRTFNGCYPAHPAFNLQLVAE
jgi:hypothetical protein